MRFCGARWGTFKANWHIRLYLNRILLYIYVYRKPILRFGRRRERSRLVKRQPGLEIMMRG